MLPVLGKMKALAETALGCAVPNAVITVPAKFGYAQRQATRDAAQIAGFNVLRLINEPTAAAIAYGLDKQVGERYVMIFDLGGGSLDVSLVHIDDGIFEVKATAGNNHLGGQDFVGIIMHHFLARFTSAYPGMDPRSSPRSMALLRTECERVKRTLSSVHPGPGAATVEIRRFFKGLPLADSL
eukprot:COSAG05_NODE_1104_length_5872_cov_4.990473_2_plen_183_part_00